MTASWRSLSGALPVCALIAAMAFDTKVVKIGSAAAIQPGVFSPAEFGAAEFPKVQSAIEKRAVDAVELYEALSKDRDAAARKYGVAANSGYVLSVKFTG